MIEQQFVNSLVIGSVYALFAVGYTLMFGVLRLLNLAQAATFMIAAVTMWFAALPWGLPLPAAILVAIIAGSAFGLIQSVVFAPLLRRNVEGFTLFLISVGISQAAISLTTFLATAQVRNLPLQMLPSQPLLLPGRLVMTDLQLGIVVLAIVVMLGLTWVVRSTSFGRAIRATAEDVRTTEMLGIDVTRVIVGTIVLSSALGSVSGVFMGLGYNTIYPYMGDDIQLTGIAVMVLGGMGSVPGAALGGYVMALAQVFAVAFGGSFYRDAIAFAVLLLILLVRPSGLMGGVGARAD